MAALLAGRHFTLLTNPNQQHQKRTNLHCGGGGGTPDNVKGKTDQKELLVLDTWAVLSAASGNVLSA